MSKIYADSSRPRVMVKRSPLNKARLMTPLAHCGICGGAIYLEGRTGGPLSLCFDHVWPKERYPGLRAEVWNLQPAHKICNERKAQRDPTLAEALRAQSRHAPSRPRRRVVRRRRPSLSQEIFSS